MTVPKVKIFTKAHVDGPKFGTKGAISHEDWDLIEELVKKHEIKSILEFGGGFSTKKFTEICERVVSLETNPAWARVVATMCPDAKIIIWDNREIPEGKVKGKFDLAFIDGADPRDVQVVYGMDFSDRLLLHDVKRIHEQRLLKDYLSDWKVSMLSNGRLAFCERTG